VLTGARDPRAIWAARSQRARDAAGPALSTAVRAAPRGCRPSARAGRGRVRLSARFDVSPDETSDRFGRFGAVGRAAPRETRLNVPRGESDDRISAADRSLVPRGEKRAGGGGRPAGGGGQ